MTWPFGSLTPLRYGAILADPPWRMKMYSVKGMGRSPDGPLTRNEQRQNNPERHYATMPLEDIRALPVGNLAAPDCVLFMWAIDPLLPEAIEVGRSWGFTYKTVAFYWAKAGIGEVIAASRQMAAASAFGQIIASPRSARARRVRSGSANRQ